MYIGKFIKLKDYIYFSLKQNKFKKKMTLENRKKIIVKIILYNSFYDFQVSFSF